MVEEDDRGQKHVQFARGGMDPIDCYEVLRGPMPRDSSSSHAIIDIM